MLTKAQLWLVIILQAAALTAGAYYVSDLQDRIVWLQLVNQDKTEQLQELGIRYQPYLSQQVKL